jgi:hypothetical protein
MDFAFKEIATLPKLAWVLRVQRGAAGVLVEHGSWVEVRERFLVEGAWNGDFAAQGIESSILMGSGGKITQEGLLLACPSHTLDRIYLYRQPDSLLASNSLPLILTRAGDDLDMRFLFYEAMMQSIIEGIDRYERVLPTRNGNGVHVRYHCNLLIDSDLRVLETPKAPVKDFAGFADYTSFLEDQIRAIRDNANHPERKVSYSPVTTISSGYDSPACAVLARRVGCQTALTFATARDAGEEDSGRLIGEQLGLRVRTFDRLAYRRKPNFPEAECYGGPTEFSSLDDELVRSLLFVGFHGDTVWDRDCQGVGRSIARGGAGGSDLTELRLRAGFILMAVPFIGCTSHPSIHRISNSIEMQPWTLGNQYDRPIPRRLVEECGVDRGLFGMKKKFATVYATEEGLENTLSAKSFEDFSEFCDEFWNWQFAVKSSVVQASRPLVHLNARASRVLHRVVRRASGLEVKIPAVMPRSLRIRAEGNLGRERLLFHWGVRKLMARYATDRAAEKWTNNHGMARVDNERASASVTSGGGSDFSDN